MPQAIYSIRKNRLKNAFLDGIEPMEDYKKLVLADTPVRRIYLNCIDSAESGSRWGRFFFDAVLTEDMALYIYAAASDQNTVYDENGTYAIDDIMHSDIIDDARKKNLLSQMNVMRFVGKSDVLLYGLTGRYLFLAIEIIGDGTGILSNFKVDARGDNFMATLPEVYRRNNSFLHRFMSIFSSIYNDFDADIEALPDLLNPDTAPVEVLLEYGKWMGIDLSGDFLTEEAMRTFVKEGYRLNRMKGTKACLLRIFEIVLGEQVIILEQNTIRAYIGENDIEEFGLKGTSIYDVNVLIKKPLSDTDRHQLLHLVRQFVPIRSQVHLISLKDSGVLDTDIYLDMNAVLSEELFGVFDDEMELDDDIIME